MLKRLVQDYQPEYVAVVFDPKGGTFRNDLYPEYKANRDEMPEELASQIKPLHDIIKAQGFPLIIEQGFEADDVIGTLSQQAETAGMKVVVSTGDKDMAQLVNENITLINTMNNKIMDIPGVKEKFDVTPEQIIDYLTLVGDTSDNIPGVPKVGPKTAAKWLNEYGTLDNIIKNAEAIKGKVGENLRNHLDNIPLCKELVTIRCDVAIAETPTELVMNERDNIALKDLYSEFELKRWLAEVEEKLGASPVEVTVASVTANYETVLTETQLKKWVDILEAAESFSFDTETTSLNAMEAGLVGISFSTKAGEAAYVPLSHDYLGAPDQLDKEKVMQQLLPILHNSKKILVGQNLKYDIKVLKSAGIELKTQLWDTMLESYVLNNVSTRHNMDTLAATFLNKETIKFEDVAGKGAKQLTFNEIALEQAGPYAAEDADITLQLYHVFDTELKSRPQCEKSIN